MDDRNNRYVPSSHHCFLPHCFLLQQLSPTMASPFPEAITLLCLKKFQLESRRVRELDEHRAVETSTQTPHTMEAYTCYFCNYWEGYLAVGNNFECEDPGEPFTTCSLTSTMLLFDILSIEVETRQRMERYPPNYGQAH